MWARLKDAIGWVIAGLLIVAILAGIPVVIADWLGAAAGWAVGIGIAAVVVLTLLPLVGVQVHSQVHSRAVEVGWAAIGGLFLGMGFALWAQNLWVWWKTGVWLGPSAGVLVYLALRGIRFR